MYLLDSDAAKSLCQYQLIEELAGALGCALSDFAVLPQLRFQLRLGTAKAIEKLGSTEAVELAQRLVKEATEVTVSSESANIVMLADRPDIDSGELVLFGALCDDNQNSLITGDKRALVALAAVDAPMIELIWARLICLEEAIALVLAHVGFEEVSSKIRARPNVNIALTIAFGNSIAHPLSDVLEGLTSYVNDIIATTNKKYQLKTFPKYGVCLGGA